VLDVRMPIWTASPRAAIPAVGELREAFDHFRDGERPKTPEELASDIAGARTSSKKRFEPRPAGEGFA